MNTGLIKYFVIPTLGICLFNGPVLAADSVTTKPYTVQKLLDNKHSSARGGAHGRNDPHAKLTPQMHIQVALQHKAEGRMAEAFMALNQAINSNPASAELLAVRGSFFLEKNNIASALSDFESAIVLDPESAAILVNRAQAYRHFGRIAEALADLDKAIKINPDLLAAYFNRGAIYYSSGEYKKALNDFDACIAINPHAAGPYFNRASAKDALGDREGAVTDIKHFMQMSADDKWKQVGQQLLDKWQDGSEKQSLENG